MITTTSTPEELVSALGDAITETTGLMESIDNDKVNKVPYEDSWTAGQLLRHVSKAMSGIGQVFGKEGEKANRDPKERVPELAKIFLDFSGKMQSPDFIVPEEGPYEKAASIAELNNAYASVKEGSQNVQWEQMVTDLPMGQVTKIELLHFITYHTQRHLYQMTKITDALNSKA